MRSDNVDDDARPTKRDVPSSRGLTSRELRSIATAKIGCSDYFVRGPIPLGWIAVASFLPGKTLIVALILWMLSGINRGRRIKFEYKWTKILGIDRHTVYRCFDRLADAGLISIETKCGGAPWVTLLACGPDRAGMEKITRGIRNLA